MREVSLAHKYTIVMPYYSKPMKIYLQALQRVQGNLARVVCDISTCHLHDSGQTVDWFHDLHLLPIRNSISLKIALLCYKGPRFGQLK